MKFNLTNISLASLIAALASRNTTTHARSILSLSICGGSVGAKNRSRLRDTFELPQGDSQISSSLVGFSVDCVTKSDRTVRKSAEKVQLKMSQDLQFYQMSLELCWRRYVLLTRCRGVPRLSFFVFLESTSNKTKRNKVRKDKCYNCKDTTTSHHVFS